MVNEIRPSLIKIPVAFFRLLAFPLVVNFWFDDESGLVIDLIVGSIVIRGQKKEEILASINRTDTLSVASI